MAPETSESRTSAPADERAAVAGTSPGAGTSGVVPSARAAGGTGETGATTTAPRDLSRYVRQYGAQHDGSVGLVLYEPVSADVLAGLHQQVRERLGVVAGSEHETEVDHQLQDLLSRTEIATHLPYLRSARGHRITVTVGGRERTVDVRLRLSDAAAATRDGGLADVARATRVERHTEGGQSATGSESSGTQRTVPISWLATYLGPEGPLRWFDGALTLNLTHHQLSQSVSVSEDLTTRTVQRVEDEAYAVDFSGQWQTRIDEDPSPNAWGVEREHGRVTVWFPESRAFGDGGTGPEGTALPQQAGLDDSPLWGVDDVPEPGRLHAELLADDAFSPLHGLGTESRRALGEFLSERTLRGTVPMQRDGGVFSPVLFDGEGRAVGVLRLTAAVRPGPANSQTPEGSSGLESWLSHGSRVDRSSRLTSGVGLDGSGGPMFTPDTAAGHPGAASRIGGGVVGKAGASFQTSDALNTTSRASLMHALSTGRSHLVAPAEVTYRLTLHHAAGGETSGTFGPWQDGLRLRLPQRDTVLGREPAPEERRQLPEQLENLQSLGVSAVPVAVRGTSGMFQEAADWLRAEGFLPSGESARYPLDESRVRARLANLRRFEQARSALGQAAAMPDAVEGGRSVWFELPGLVAGTRRVELRLRAERDRVAPPGTAGMPPALHERRLTDVEGVTFSSHEARGGRLHSHQVAATAGGGGGPRWPLGGGAWALDTTGDRVWGRRQTRAVSAGSAAGTDQFNSTRGGTDRFSVPARFSLDLFEGAAADPTVRFGGGASSAPGTAGTSPGHVTLLVAHDRTLPPGQSITPSPARDTIRAPRTDGGAHDDYRRLALTDDQGRPQPGLVRLPDDANVDFFRASAALREAFRALATGTYPGRPDAGTFGQLADSFTGYVPAPLAAVGGGAAAYLAGSDAEDRSAFATEALDHQTRVADLIGRAHQILGSGHVIEGLAFPGLGADQELSVEIQGYLHHPVHSGTFQGYGESDLTAADFAARSRTATDTRDTGVSVGGLQSLPAVPAGAAPPRVPQSNPGARLVGSRRTDDTRESSASTSVTRVPVESGTQHLITTDATLLVTVRHGTRNFAGNLVGWGARDAVTLAIDLPRAVQFRLHESQLARFAPWFAGVQGVPRPALADATVPPPESFARTRSLGFGSVMSVVQLDDPVRRQESRDRTRRELLGLVEREAPGATRPGHVSYRTGVATRVADLASPAQLRALPGRGTVSLYFRHHTQHGARLVEVTLSAEPQGQTPALRELRGRPAGAGSGLEQVGAHTPNGRAESRQHARGGQFTGNLITRYPRPADASRTDRTGPVFGASATRASASRTDVGADDRYWTRTGAAADFDDIPYVLTATVRSELVWEWPPDLVGGLLEEGWVTLTGRDGGGLAERLGRLLHGRPTRRVEIPASVAVRFAGAETAAPHRHDPPLAPGTAETDPRTVAGPGAQPAGARPFTDRARLTPTGVTPVLGFNAFHELADALREVAPDTDGLLSLPVDAPPEAIAVRLGELVRGGTVSVGTPRTAAGLTPAMPGAWVDDPVDTADTTPYLEVTLHNPRPVTSASDIAVDRVRTVSRSASGSSTSGSAAGLSYQSTLSGNDPNLHHLGFTVPLFTRQQVTRGEGGATTGGGWDRAKNGNPAVPESGAATRNHEVLVDTVVRVSGPNGTRYVLGSALTRVFDRDLLGHGAIGPRSASRVYDLPALLHGEPDGPLRDWARHPVTELPGVLARGMGDGREGVQLWLDLGADPEGTRLARSLYVAARTAVAAGRPVELVTRGGTGLRFWPLTADGVLADHTPATVDTWNRLRSAMDTVTRATAAEADAAAREAALVPREARASADAAAAREAHTAAHTAYTEAVADHAAARDALDRQTEQLRAAETVRTEAERLATALTGADPAAATNGTAEADPVPADLARDAVRRAVAEVERLRGGLTTAEEQVRDAARQESVTAEALARATLHRDQLERGHGELRTAVQDARREQQDQRAAAEAAWATMPGMAGVLSADRCREGVGGARYPLDSLSSTP